jgi:hypothetical protein
MGVLRAALLLAASIWLCAMAGPGMVAAPGEPKSPADWANPNCLSPRSGEEADLCQQRRMADSAARQIELTTDQNELIRLEVFGLFGTILISAVAAWSAAFAAKSTFEIERAHISGGPGYFDLDPKTGENRVFVTIQNYGMTPGELTDIAFVLCRRADLANGPDYSQRAAYVNTIKPSLPTTITNVSRVFDAISDDQFVYGRIWYRDVDNRFHSFGFIHEIRDKNSYPLPTNEFYDAFKRPDFPARPADKATTLDRIRPYLPVRT